MVNLHLGDCMEAMAKMPDNVYELAIVDPPYAVGASDGKFGRGGLGNNGHLASLVRKDMVHYANHNETPTKEYFTELFRVSKNQIIWGANYYPEHLSHSGWIVWDKKKDCNPILSDAELAYQSFNKVVKMFRFQWFGFAKQAGSFEDGQKQTIHPNQKPVQLYKWLLHNYAKEGDRILDTHGGSMSIAIACHDMGFDLDLWELDAEYYAKGVERFNRHKAQLKLF
jgi:site-specific DNA-methyltransferase (adenine-specific)